MDTKLSVGKFDRVPEKLGIVDGGQIHFDCCNCGAPLCIIWVTMPDVDSVNKIRAKCCHCGDYSLTQEVVGLFSLGHGGVGEGDDFVIYSQFEAPNCKDENDI